MILRFEISRAQGANTGLSLLETLIALAIIALIMGISAGAFRGPSPTLRLQKEAAALIGTASNLRNRAIREGKTFSLETQGATCDDTKTPLSFFSDGTAQGPDLCLQAGAQHLRLTLNALTGRLSQANQ